MNVRHASPYLKAPGLILAALLTAALPASAQTSPCQTAGRREPQKPNIIFILTDDQDLMLHSMDYMQNVKALLENQGATFDDYFVPLSLCCPSRTAILRGQYPHNTKIWTNTPPDGGFQKAYADSLESHTVATALQRAGYKTFFFGKYLNGYPATASQTYIPPGWNEWYSPVSGDPYGEYNYSLNENGTVVSFGNAPSDYLTDVMSAKAVAFVHQMAQDPSHPAFFMHLTPFAPHRPSTPAPRDANLFPGVQAPRTPSFNEADMTGKPAYMQSLPLLTDQNIQEIDAEYRLRLQSLQAVDDMVGAIVNELTVDGLLGNTYIFFSSDNGYHMGQHRFLAGKYTPYETDIRVPLVVVGPGVPAGLQIKQFVEEVDLAPTFADLGGVTMHDVPDGRSLIPLLKGEKPSPWRQSVLIEQIKGPAPQQAGLLPQDRQAEPPDPQDLAMTSDWPGHQGYRTSDYKYVEYSTGEKELYYLGPDPDEMTNEAAVAAPNFLNAASAYLGTLTSCKGPGCSAAEDATPPSPVTVDFNYTPLQPTDATPVTFVGSADGTPPYTFTWDLGGQSAEGETVTRTFPPGVYTITLDVTDAGGAQDASSQTITIDRSVMIGSVKAAQPPFRLTVTGSGFKTGCSVAVDGNPAPATRLVSGTKVVAKGSGLKALVPKGTAVQIVVTNADGTASAPFSYTR